MTKTRVTVKETMLDTIEHQSRVSYSEIRNSAVGTKNITKHSSVLSHYTAPLSSTVPGRQFPYPIFGQFSIPWTTGLVDAVSKGSYPSIIIIIKQGRARLRLLTRARARARASASGSSSGCLCLCSYSAVASRPFVTVVS